MATSVNFLSWDTSRAVEPDLLLVACNTMVICSYNFMHHTCSHNVDATLSTLK
jgi:hypothetical protein